MRAVTVVEVAEPSVWAELDAIVALAPHVDAELSPVRRIVRPSFEKDVLPKLRSQGVTPLVRYARREAAEVERAAETLQHVVDALPDDARRVLHAAQRHARDGLVLGLHAWDPEADAVSVRILHGQGLLDDVPEGPETRPYAGRYRLNPDLPPAPDVPYDFADAVMDETDDLPAALPGPVALLHDLASLAAAIEHAGPRRTHQGTVARADVKKLATRLGAKVDDLEKDVRWGRALRGLEALRVVSMDPVGRELHLDMGLEATLSGDAAEAVDHLVHRMVEPDLQGVLPAVRAALRQAGDGAVDELVFFEVLRDQHRDVLFPGWRGGTVYPLLEEHERPRAWDDQGWEEVETPMIVVLLGRLQKLGLLRRAPGVFAATEDGQVWARVHDLQAPPIWISGDLEIVVPPNAVTPWERFQLERLGRCLSRDVVDRYRMERASLETWLSTHDVEEALALLRRRSPAVPSTVEDTLRQWARSASRVVLVRGVVVTE